MRNELALRQRHGFAADWLEGPALWDGYGIRAPGAILTRLAARVDPYRLTYRLFARLARRGTQVFDRSGVTDLRVAPAGVTLATAQGSVRARHVVLAAGYATQDWLQARVARNRSSHATIANLAIAAAKALLVMIIYMRLKTDSPLQHMVAIAGFAWLALLIALSLADMLTRVPLAGW